MKYVVVLLSLVSVRCLAEDISSYKGIFVFYVDTMHSYVISPGDLKVKEIYKIKKNNSYQEFSSELNRKILIYQMMAETSSGVISFEIDRRTGCIQRVKPEPALSLPNLFEPFKSEQKDPNRKHLKPKESAYDTWKPVTQP